MAGPGLALTCPTCRRGFPAGTQFCPYDGTNLGGGASLVGMKIGNFTIERLIGEGAMGAVYLGVHDTLRRKVAIKFLLPELARDAGLVDRFIDEARAVSGIGHPALIQIFDFGVTPDGRRYSVMELLEGSDLEHVLKAEGRLDPWRVAALGAQIADGLAAAHEQGIIHRDLKPANLFLTRNASGEEQIKILDFGIAKLLGLDKASAVERTKAGAVIGTPRYLSPEQALGRTDLDARSDMYSLGVVLYELMAGRPPFTELTTVELLVRHANDPPPPLGEVAPWVPAELSAIVMRCLEKPREARFGSMRELRIAILSLRAGSAAFASTGMVFATGVGAGGTAPGTTLVPPQTTGGGAAKWIALAVVVAVAGALIAVFALRQHPRKKRPGGPGLGLGLGGPRTGPRAGLPGGGDGGTSSAGAPGVASKNPFRGDDTAALAGGAAIWRSKCERCHGAKGEGDGKDTPPGLSPKSFADSRTVPGLLDAYRFEIVRRGVEQDGKFTMPSFAQQLGEDDTWRVITYVSTLAPEAATPTALDVPAEPPLDHAMEQRGADLFKLKCQSCHGRHGRGDGPAREFLGRYPADLTTGVFKLRSTPKGQLPTDADLFHTLSEGMGVGGMPSFARLPAADRWALVAHVKTLSSKFARQKEAPELVPVPPQPPASPGAVERGKKAFTAAGCAGCHGDTGHGDGPKAANLKDAAGHAVKPTDLTSPFLFIGGSTPVEVYRTMMTGVGGTPMPQGADFFDANEAWDVVAYILSLRSS